jgi:hypothetical protein
LAFAQTESVVDFEEAEITGRWIESWEAKGVVFTPAHAPTRSKAKAQLMFFPHISSGRKGILSAMATDPIPVRARFAQGASSVTLVLWGSTGCPARLEAYDQEGKLLDQASLETIPGRTAPGDPIPAFELTVKGTHIAYVEFSGPRAGEFLAADELRFLPAGTDPDFHIYLCFGQSNMESGGRMNETDRTVDERFRVMADFDAPDRGWKKDNWYHAVPPLAAMGNGICLVDSFGRTLVTNLPGKVRVGVIKVSVPGCKIELFDKDSYQAYVDTAPDWMKNLVRNYGGNPYRYLVDMAKAAQKDGVIKGILLHQGESNPGDKEWPNKVRGIYDNLIKDLNLNADEVPLLAGELVNADQEGRCAGFNEIMAELPETLPNSHVISSAGCATNDRLHFNSEGSREFGKRYGERMLSLLGYEIVEITEGK